MKLMGGGDDTPPNDPLARFRLKRTLPSMSMTLHELVNEARRLPPGQMAELFDVLLAETFAAPDAVTEAAWRQETQRRVAEIQDGRITGVPGEMVMAELRRIVGR
jgi:putative addiction module component (TIGR02574 family)